MRVPHQGKAESLNLAAAATVCLFEWARRRRSGTVALETIVAAAAHDIRSPLTAMKGFGYALEKRWESMTEEQRTLMLRGIVYDADRMDAILRLLVDAGRVASGSLELFPERIDLSELALRASSSRVRRDPEHPEVRWAGKADVVVTDPARAEERDPVVHRGAGLVGPRGTDHDRGQAGSATGCGSPCGETGPSSPTERRGGLFAARRPGTGAGSKIGLFVARGVAETQGGRAWADVRTDGSRSISDIPLSTPG